MKLRTLALAAAIMLPASAAQAEFANNVNPQYADCRTQNELTLPVITSGVDLVSLYANDYEASSTATGSFGDNGVEVGLELNNDLVSQLENYMSCRTPFMRLTQGQLNLVSNVTTGGATPVGVFQFGWSNGADALVTRPGNSNPVDLSGKRIAVQKNGTSLDFLARILRDARDAAGASWQEPEIVWTEDASGFYGDSPAAVFLNSEDVDAAFVKVNDASVLTSDGIGTGAEGSVKGARTLLSTKSLNRAVSHVLVVRKDYYDANIEQVQNVVQSLLDAEDKVREDILKQIVEWDKVAEFMYGDDAFEEDVKLAWRSMETVGLQGNREWSGKHPRNFANVNQEVAAELMNLGLIAGQGNMQVTNWDWDSLGGGLFDTRDAQISSFDQDAATDAVSKMQATGDIESNTLTEFEINFEPNQAEFSTQQYGSDFAEVVDLVSTYGGAVLTVEGHVDPTRYLVMKYKEKATDKIIKRQLQSALTLSLSRAQAVRDAIMQYAEEQGVVLDQSQFVIDGRGIEDPATGICGDPGIKCPGIFDKGDPAPPRTAEEIRSNMRVVFRMINVEAEADVLTPVVSWE